MRLIRGIPEAHRRAAAVLFWQAFGPKLARIIGPTDRALAFLENNIHLDRAIGALDDDGRLLGLVSYQTPEGGFTQISFGRLAAGYGWTGALWRGLALRMITRRAGDTRFLIDGLCVSADRRGQGIGSRLLAEVAALAGELDYAEVRLDVTDTNPRARALYARLGFVPLRTERLRLLRPVFGFAAATTMARPVADWPAPRPVG